MTNSNKIVASQLNFFYNDFKALEDISIEFKKNQVSALIGPSGCGKSTFPKVLQPNDGFDSGHPG